MAAHAALLTWHDTYIVGNKKTYTLEVNIKRFEPKKDNAS